VTQWDARNLALDAKADDSAQLHARRSGRRLKAAAGFSPEAANFHGEYRLPNANLTAWSRFAVALSAIPIVAP